MRLLGFLAGDSTEQTIEDLGLLDLTLMTSVLEIAVCGEVVYQLNVSSATELSSSRFNRCYMVLLLPSPCQGLLEDEVERKLRTPICCCYFCGARSQVSRLNSLVILLGRISWMRSSALILSSRNYCCDFSSVTFQSIIYLMAYFCMLEPAFSPSRLLIIFQNSVCMAGMRTI